MINILPDAVIGVGRHRFVELLPLHRLKGRDDFRAPETDRSGAFQGSAGGPKPAHAGKGRLECFELVSGLSLVRHHA